MLSTAMLPIFQNLGVGVSELQMFVTIAASPWSVKPITGILSDLLTIRGYHKRYWLVHGAVVGIVASSLLFATQSIPRILVLCFLGLNYEMAVVDLLTESKYAQQMQEFPETGGDLVTFATGLQMIGGTIAMGFAGEVSDEKIFLVFYVIAVILACSPLLPSLLGWLPEEQEINVRCVEFDKSLFRQNRAVFIVVAFAGLAGPAVAFLATYSNKWLGLSCAVLLLIGIMAGTYTAFPLLIANVALYQLVVRISKPSIGTALDYFFTAKPDCLVDGPHFGFKYFITYTGITSQCVGFLGVWLYQLVLSKYRYRPVLILTTALVGLGGLSDLIIVLRLNIAIGIPDHAFYIIGEAVFESVVAMLYWVPSSIVISKVCPVGLESVTYAFLAGISNFGLILSELLGAVIYESAGVTKCSFDNLWWLVLVFHILVPIIVGVPATLLIPNAYQNVELLNEERMLIQETSDIEFESFSGDDNEVDFENSLTDYN